MPSSLARCSYPPFPSGKEGSCSTAQRAVESTCALAHVDFSTATPVPVRCDLIQITDKPLSGLSHRPNHKPSHTDRFTVRWGLSVKRCGWLCGWLCRGRATPLRVDKPLHNVTIFTSFQMAPQCRNSCSHSSPFSFRTASPFCTHHSYHCVVIASPCFTRSFNDILHFRGACLICRKRHQKALFPILFTKGGKLT